MPKKCCKPKPKICIKRITPDYFVGDCSLPSFQLSFSVTGKSKDIAAGTVVTLQYTRSKDQKTAVAIGSTTIDSNGGWSLVATNLTVNDPSLGNLNIFAQAMAADGITILAYTCGTISIKCVKPRYPQPCKARCSSSSSSSSSKDCKCRK